MKVEQIKQLLGGYNCGGCGYEDCKHCAMAILEKEAPVDICPMIDEENIEQITNLVEEK